MRSSENTGTRDGKVRGTALASLKARDRPIARMGASSFSPQSLKSPASTRCSLAGTSALMKAAMRSTWRTRPECIRPRWATMACTVLPFHCTGTCSRPRCSKRWSDTSWWPESPSGQRDSSALPCSPSRVTALVR